MVRGYAAHYRLPIAHEALTREALSPGRLPAARARATSPFNTFRIWRVAWPAPRRRRLVGVSRRVRHVLGRVDRARAFAQLEMELRLIDLTGTPGLGDDLAAAHLIATLDQDFVIVGVGRHPIVGVPDQYQIAVAL